MEGGTTMYSIMNIVFYYILIVTSELSSWLLGIKFFSIGYPVYLL